MPKLIKARAAADEKVRSLETEVKKLAKASPIAAPLPGKVEKKSAPGKAGTQKASSATNATVVAKMPETKPPTAAVASTATNAPVAAVTAPKAAGQTTNAVVVVDSPLEAAQKALAKAMADTADLAKRVASLTRLVKTTLPARLVAARTAVEKSTKELAANQAMVDRLTTASTPKSPQIGRAHV